MSRQPARAKAGTAGTLSIPAKTRLSRELSLLNSDPPPGVAAYLPCSSEMSHIRAQITGPEGSPFEGGVFLLSVRATARYPFEPPRVRFLTPLYHPNVDSAGRICLDTLKSPPAGSWSPAVSLPCLLLSVRSLMAEPNPDDGLVPEISDLYKRDPKRWAEEAKRRTNREATADMAAEMERKLDGETQPASSLREAPQDPPSNSASTEGKRGDKRSTEDQCHVAAVEEANTSQNDQAQIDKGIEPSRLSKKLKSSTSA